MTVHETLLGRHICKQKTHKQQMVAAYLRYLRPTHPLIFIAGNIEIELVIIYNEVHICRSGKKSKWQ